MNAIVKFGNRAKTDVLLRGDCLSSSRILGTEMCRRGICTDILWYDVIFNREEDFEEKESCIPKFSRDVPLENARKISG